LAKTAAEFVHRKISFDEATVADTNLPGFLGNYNRDSIRFFTYAKPSAGPEPKAAIKIFALS